MRSRNKYIVLAILALAMFAFSGSMADARDDKSLFDPSSPRILSTTSGATELVYTGACTVYSFAVAGASSSAGDVVTVYDNTSATGVPKLEITIAVTGETYSIPLPPGGVSFENGIYVTQTDSNLFSMLSYE